MWTAFLTFTDGGATVPLMMLTMFLPVGHSLGFRLVSNFYGNPAMSLASTSILAFASFVWGTWMVYASVSSSIFLMSDSILQQIWWFRAQVFNAPDFKVTLTIPTALWPYLMNVILWTGHVTCCPWRKCIRILCGSFPWNDGVVRSISGLITMTSDEVVRR